MINVSKNIKHFRNNAGLTQEALAEKISVTRQAISSWERGVTQPDINMLTALSENLGVSIEEIIYGEKKKIGLEKPEKEKRNPLFIVLSVFGSLLVCTGLIIVFASFWEKLGELVKGISSFLPLFVGFTAYMIIDKKKSGNVVAMESAAVLWTAGYMATNAIVNAYFKADAGFANIFLIDMLLLIPLIIYTKALIPIMSLFVMSAAFPIYTISGGHFRSTVIEIILVIAMYVFAVLYSRKIFRDGRVGKTAVTWLALLSGAFILCEIPTYINMLADANNSSFAPIITVIPFFCAGLILAGDGVFGLDSVTFPSSLLSATYLSFIALNGLLEGGDEADFGEFILPLIAGIVPFVFAVVFSAKKRKASILEVISAGLTLVTIPIIMLCGGDFEDSIAGVVLALISVIFGVMLIIRGMKALSLALVNLGIIEICFILGVITVGSSVDVIVKGSVILGAGLLLLVVNRILISSFAKKNGGEENA